MGSVEQICRFHPQFDPVPEGWRLLDELLDNTHSVLIEPLPGTIPPYAAPADPGMIELMIEGGQASGGFLTPDQAVRLASDLLAHALRIKAR